MLFSKQPNTPHPQRMTGTIVREFLQALRDKSVTTLASLGDIDPMLLTKCRRRCEVCLAGYPDPTLYTPQTLKKLIQECAQAMLDYTYHEECQLVHEEFPNSNSRERIKQIFDDFDQITGLSRKCLPENKVADVLGSEINECLVWRRGALLYMYCKTVKDDPNRAQEIDQEFMQLLHTGIIQLKNIMPSPQCSDTEGDPGPGGTLKLVDMGILNDTYLLGMMYGGEMCFWYYKAQLDKTEDISFDKDFDAKDTGRNFLLPYIEAVDGVLSVHGWSSHTAKQIIKYFSEH